MGIERPLSGAGELFSTGILLGLSEEDELDDGLPRFADSRGCCDPDGGGVPRGTRGEPGDLRASGLVALRYPGGGGRGADSHWTSGLFPWEGSGVTGKPGDSLVP